MRGGAVLAGGHDPGPVLHFPVGQGGAVLHHQDPLPGHDLAAFHQERGSGVHHGGLGVQAQDAGPHRVHPFGGGGFDLVDHDDVGPQQIHASREVGQLVPRAVGVHQGDPEVRLEEGDVVVAAVPEHDLGLFLGFGQDGRVVHPGVDREAHLEVRLVLFHFFYSTAVLLHVLQALVALHPLALQVPVGHGMAHHHRPAAVVFQSKAKTGFAPAT